MIYFAKLHKDKKGYWTEFPEFKSPGSQGRTIEEVRAASKEALEGLLESLFDHRCEIPSPRRRKGRGWLSIQVDDAIAIPIILRQLRLSQGLTLKQMAKKLGIAYQSYQALETLKKANPTIKTLRKISQALGLPVSEILKDVA